MSRDTSIDDLHDELFALRPSKPGDRFERIVAVVFAVLEDAEVRHRVLMSGPGRRAKHEIDVRVIRAGGSGTAIIECKHWKDLVPQDVVNSLVGRRTQLGAAEAIIVTTVGYTKGALDVARDEGVRLVRVRVLAEDEHWHGVLREIRSRAHVAVPVITHAHWRSVDRGAAAQLQAAGHDLRWDPETVDHVEFPDGTPAERYQDLMNGEPPSPEGTRDFVVELDGPRYLRINKNLRIAVDAFVWTETVVVGEWNFTVGPPSAGRLLIEEVSADPSGTKRVLMDHEMNVWDISADGDVEERGDGA